MSILLFSLCRLIRCKNWTDALKNFMEAAACISIGAVQKYAMSTANDQIHSSRTFPAALCWLLIAKTIE